ncbi:Uu.00g098290.m01.CDS01 [Anthostomella pinea]|uniref:Uu.00g098290.m01.CDS01 n=1 Tax=Anthostomella pinea TaxID=933095 RepID=A0AAI8VDJ7_9PEZI|nr:Uu.00g098290.m01.CDS01 [Anthostomella pinea]
MAPITHEVHLLMKRGDEGRPTDPDALVLEAWAQGFMVGSLVIMAFITMSNMRKGVLLHKLILLELLLGVWQGFFIFFHNPVYAWWLSVSAIPLNISWVLHNVVAFLKIKPFLSKRVRIVYIVTVAVSLPYWVVEIYANFAYFHNINDLFLRTRPFEALCRDPWWIFTTFTLFYSIKTRYEISFSEIMRISPRFGIMLLAMIISIIFLIVDICSVLDAFQSSLPVGINPFWKLAFVFKCLTDTVILDDFKTALDKLRAWKMAHFGSYSFGQDATSRTRTTAHYAKAWEEIQPGSDSQRTAAVSYVAPDDDQMPKGNFIGVKTTIVQTQHKTLASSPTGLSSGTSTRRASTEDIIASAPKAPEVTYQQGVDRWTEVNDDAYPLRPIASPSPLSSPNGLDFPHRS